MKIAVEDATVVARPVRRFHKVNIEISNVCNLQCTFCPEVIRTKGMMEPALFRRVIEQVAPLTEQVCFHLMGEPLLHRRLAEFIAICGEHAVPIFLVSNGVLLNEEKAQLLLDPAIRQVNFSLHSFGDNFPGRDPSSYLERIFVFTERAFRERPDLYVNYRLWNLEAPAGGGEGNGDLLARIEARFGWKMGAMRDVRTHKSRRIRDRLYLHFDTEFVWPSVELPILGTSGTCHGLSTHFGVLVDGTVVPCCLDKEGNIPLGNLKDTPIEVILEGPRASGMKRGFRERKLLEDLCRRCQYIERFTPVSKEN